MNDAKKTKRKDIRRRALAAVCAITIAVLQCAVVLTIDTESAYAAAEVKVSVYVPSVSDSTNTSNKMKVSDIGSETDITIGYDEATGDPITVKGHPVGALIDKVKTSPSPSKVTTEDGGSLVNLDSSDMIVEKDGKAYIYQQSGDIWVQKANAKDGIDMTMPNSYRPEVASIAIDPSSLSLAKDEQKNLKAKVTFSSDDDFFNGSSDEAKKYVNITWSCVAGSGNAAFSSASGMETTITVKTAGTYTINATDSISKKAGSVQDNGEKATTAPPETKPSTANPKDVANATVTAHNLVKGKAYSTSEMKEHLTLKDPNDKTIDKKYWDVKSVSRDENEYSVIIKGKNGYTGLNESTVKATKSGSKLTAKYKYTTRKYSGGGVTRSTRINGDGGETTSSLPPNVTYAPDRTITVKEVFLGPQIQEELQETTNPWDNTTADDWNDSNDDWSEADMEDELYLDFGPAAGSAAAAAAACGAGMVGRIRRFRVDTRAASAAASQTGKTKKLKLKK